jgi:5-methylcytosine-specific restriction endonuclease McrBC GTP-binding regulatory subunit McrB
LIEFPLERLKNLAVEEYTNLNKSDSFCYWVETKLRKLGSIQGSTSYKFGIYEFNKEPREGSGYSHDEKYAWLSKYGSDSKSAYETILSNLVKIAERAQVGDFEAIDSIDMSNMFKWKIAFLYSDYKLLNVFSEDSIRYLSKKFGMMDSEKAKFSQMYKYLLEQKGEEEDVFEYSAKIWNEWFAYKTKVEGDKKWFPDESVYNPNISREQWTELLIDKEIFTENALITFACILKATKPSCADMANEFGHSVSFYNTNVFNTGRKVCKKTNCPLDTRENGDVRYWSVCCLGRDLSNGRFEYKIRPELEEAFEETGILEDLEVYEKDSKNNMKYDKEPCGLVNKFTTLLKSTRNLILTGAPGTGKTYLAKEIATAMGCSENEIGFVQFHPSYDYTDFVEGLRPISKDNCDNIGFERKDGVFKEFCKKALKNFYDSNMSVEDRTANDCFEKVYHQLLEDVENGNCSSYDTTKGKFCVEVLDNENLRFEQNCGRYKNVKKEYLKILFNVVKNDETNFIKNINRDDLCKLVENNIKSIKTVDYIQYRWALEQLVQIYRKDKDTYKTDISNKLPLRPFVFIIDEINRGEISKIFGELFFSIDPGYRGEKGRVKTQYQNLVEEGDLFGDGFFVPENVYIIGTMNDIDRSVESMDFAFRRRFAFAEVKAEDNVGMLDALEVLGLKDDAIKTMMSLNKAISEIDGLSPAYHIGASYFLKLKEYDGDWEALWSYHLEGLLCEYLRGMPNMDELMEKLENAYWRDESDSDN